MSKLRQDDPSALPEAPEPVGSWDQSSSFGSLLEEVAQASEYELATPRSQERAVLPSTLGPYRIHGVLGRGGMGIVYRGEHMQTGEPAAVKTVRVPDETTLAGIRREIHVLAGIQHPGVVRILAEGLQDGLPWYAMELLEGVTLRIHVTARIETQTMIWPEPWWTESLEPGEGKASPFSREAVATSPSLKNTDTPSQVRSERSVLPLQATLALICRVCNSLAFLHGEGIVHRDLKPENILVVPTRAEAGPDWPVLMDFGLVSRFGGEVLREALELGRASGGTVAYMAPEQARGELVDARADLYGLGCILYELVTGRPPFLGHSPLDVVKQHLASEPIAPSHLNGALPHELDALMVRLLAKQPRDRIGHADDVATALRQLGASDRLAALQPRSRAYLYRPSLAGRGDVLARFERLIAGLSSGGGGVAFVGGESGVGKTRLVMEVARRADLRAIRVLTGECVALGVPEAGSLSLRSGLYPLRPALRTIADRCRERGRGETERILGRRGKVLALHEPLLAALPGQDSYPEPEELPAAAATVRLFSDLTETFAAFTQEQPALLILDDLHWADELTHGFLGFLLRSGALARIPLLILGTHRTEETGEELSRLVAHPGAESIRLDRLAEEAVRAMIGDMLALSPAPAVLGRVVTRQSEGNPFFVAEYLRLSVEEGIFFRDEQGRWQAAGDAGETAESIYESLALPRALRELIGRRLESLPRDAAALLEAAAVVGREIPAALLWPMTEMPEGTAMSGLAELLRRQVLEEAGTAFRFVHDKIREVAYSRLGPEQRRNLHRSAAEGIEAVFAGQLDEYLAALGQHWEEAGETTRARDSYLEAARAASARSSFEEATRLARHATRLGGGASSRLVLVNALTVLSRFSEALGVAREILEIPETSDDERAQSRMKMSSILAAQGDYGGAIREAELVLLPPIPAAFRGQSLNLRSKAFWRLGRYDLALEDVTEAIAIAQATADLALEATAISHLSMVHCELGSYDEALAYQEEALRLHRQLGRGPAESLNNLGLIHWARGSYDQARAYYEESLTMHRATGNRDGIAITLHNLGTVHDARGAYSESLAATSDALAIRREIGDWRGMAASSLNLGSALFETGEWAVARTRIEESLALAREVQNPLLVAAGLDTLGVFETEFGRFPEGEQWFEESIRVSEEHGLKHVFANTFLHRARGRLDSRDSRGRNDAERSLRACKEMRTVLGERSALAVVARYDTVEGHSDLALEKLERARSLVADGRDFQLDLQFLEDEAAIRLAIGDRERAKQLIDRLSDLAESHGVQVGSRHAERLRKALDATDSP